MPEPGAGGSGRPADIARCEVHGLLYPTTESGCVVCRRAAGAASPNANTSVSAVSPPPKDWVRNLALGAAVAGVLAGAWIWLHRPGVMQVGASGHALRNHDYTTCLEHCRSLSESCLGLCEKGDPAARCRPSCLLGHGQCTQRCGLEQKEVADNDLPAYWSGKMPPWDEVLLALRPAFEKAAACRVPSAAGVLRVQVSNGSSVPNDLVVASLASDVDFERCASTALGDVRYPGSTTPYLFVAGFDARQDVVDRAMRAANTNFATAQEFGDSEAVAAAQQRVWVMRAKVQEKQEEARKRAQQKAEEDAKRANTHYMPPPSWPRASPAPDWKRQQDQPLQRSAPPATAGDRTDAEKRRAIRETELEVEDMREQRMMEERWEREQKQEEVRALDKAAEERHKNGEPVW